MKNQFIIKSAQSLKTLVKPIAKSESTDLLKFGLASGKDGKCCEDYMLITGLSKSALSLSSI